MADVKDWPSLAKPDPEWDQFVKDNMGGNQPDVSLFFLTLPLLTRTDAHRPSSASSLILPV